MRITFSIATCNGLELTRACLRSLEQTVDLSTHEVLIIDDASTDETPEFLSTLQHPYRTFLNKNRLGFAANHNHNARSASGDLLCLLNNDLFFLPHWLEPMLEIIQHRPNAGIVGNVQWSPRTGRYDHMGQIVGEEIVPCHLGQHWPFHPFRGVRQYLSVTGACILIRRDLFLEHNGFDVAYRNGCEDTDLCLRLHTTGKRNYVAHESIIHHHVSSAPGRNAQDKPNEKLLLERWETFLRSERKSSNHRKWAAINYILRFLDRPWRYNGPKLLRALGGLLRG